MPGAFTTNTAEAILSGTAPVGVATIQVNGAARPVTWTSVTTWVPQATLGPGTNRLSVVGVDRHDQPVPGASNLVTVVSTSPPRSPFRVFINEWMPANTPTTGLADPADGDFEDWFELFNAGTNPADLAGCFMTYDLARPFQFEVPAGYSVPAGGFLLVGRRRNQPKLA